MSDIQLNIKLHKFSKELDLIIAKEAKKIERALVRELPKFMQNEVLPEIQMGLELQFESEGAHWSGGWAAHSDSYWKSSEKSGSNHPVEIGQLTGQLKDVATGNQDGADFDYNVSGLTSVSMSYSIPLSVIPYADAFHSGVDDAGEGLTGSYDIPARPIFPEGSELRAFISDLKPIANAWATRTIKRVVK